MEMDFLHSKFPLGRLVITKAVMDKISSDDKFEDFVYTSLKNYISCGDKESNDHISKFGKYRLTGLYNDSEHPDWSIWIITNMERTTPVTATSKDIDCCLTDCLDKNATTILFPSEY